ncbi:MAG TPA: NAD(P)/FAD-dependent oxidoreductase [Candidatus Lustribacter sp.]|nr:NAD(P)/FAD-dependent oxidoreductase [Candidatus Lustribacter sp.]
MVGGGHNGLIAAAYCARAGLRTIVLERRAVLGGAAVTEPVWPGYRVSLASYVCSLLDPQVVADLDLTAHGYHAYRKEPASFTPLAGGRSLLLGSDDVANAAEIARFEPRDVAGFGAFETEATRLGAALFDSFADAEPSTARFDAGTRGTLFGPVADLVERYVRTPVLQATLATDGLIGTGAGPRDPGTAYVLAHHYAGRALGVQGAWGFVRGGMGAVSSAAAAAARAAGATLRTNSVVERIALRDGRAARLELRDGTTIDARTILVNADPKTLFLHLLERGDVPPALHARATAWRSNGVSLKINLALGELPDFTARPGTREQPHHRATIHVAPSIDFLQQAHDDARQLGTSREPMLECFMQTPTDPSLAPPGKHILSIFAQYFPYDRTDRPWASGDGDALADRIVAQLAAYAPNLPNAIEHRQVLTPPDLEALLGLAGGHIFHGELLPGQIYEDRFGVRTGIDGLYLCGSGTHPGGCVSGFPGRRAATAAIADTLSFDSAALRSG